MSIFQKLIFSSLRRGPGFTYRFHRRFTPSGKIVLIGIFITAAFGINTKISMIFQLFSILLVMMALSMAAAAFYSVRFAVRREFPTFLTMGQPAEYWIEVTNLTQRAQHGLKILDDLADARPDWQEFQMAREPGEEQRNWFDRQTGYYRFQWLRRRKQGGEVKPIDCLPLPPFATVRMRMVILPLRRGMIHFRGTTLARPDPLNLFNSLFSLAKPQSMMVLPKRYRLPPLFRIPGGRRFQQGGVSLAESVGDAEEFINLRDYRDGDSPRHIHWPSLAKCGKPMVKQYQEEYFVRYGLILDTFSQGLEDSFEEAISVAASYAATIETGESLLDLLFVGHAAYLYTAGRGVAHADQILEVLAQIAPCTDKPFIHLTGLVLEHASRLSGSLLILLAWDEPRRGLVNQLLALDIPVAVMVIVPAGQSVRCDPGPMGPHLDRFVVLEAGRVQEGLARC